MSTEDWNAAALALIDIALAKEMGTPLPDLSAIRIAVDVVSGTADGTALAIGASAVINYLAAQIAAQSNSSVEDVLTEAQWSFRVDPLVDSSVDDETEH